MVVPPMSIPNASQASGLDNPVMMPAMPPPAQPIFVDANRMPLLPSQPFPPMPQSMPMAQTQYQTPAYMPQSQGQYQGMPQPQQAPNMQQSSQPQVQRPDDIRTSVSMPAVQAPPPPPPPPQGEWRGGSQM